MTIKAKAAALAAAIALIGSGAIYPQTAAVTAVEVIDEQEKVYKVTVETASRYQYSYYGDGDIEPGDLLSLIMWDNMSKTITDDTILKIKYTGYRL